MAENAGGGEVWVLGAGGRIGGAVSASLVARGVRVVMVGRDATRLRAVVPESAVRDGTVETVEADNAYDIAARIRQRRPAVVVNVMGGFARNAVPIARACMPGGHYVDAAADIPALTGLLGLHAEALAGGSTLVTAAGFGVLGTEAVVARLCEGRPTPSSVRVDALASVATVAGTVGEAFAATTADVITSGGLAYEDGHLVRTRLGSDVRRLTLPDGETVRSASAPSGELLAARRASGAPSVAVTSALAPTAFVVRAAVPLLKALLSIPAVRRVFVRGMAGSRLKAAPMPRSHSWGHAVVSWPDGVTREGWLRAGDGMDFTADTLTEVAVRLARGEGKPGAHTPAAAFGPELAVAAGATLLVD
ncbi:MULTISPECIES: hypothetical protein [unclassified Streptomyces]|uniref:hypothetical protein n=1 Tax=unclassified Streptomyces TaxID=2593676 RepID=UPI00382365A6